jgi:hypothetical protein
VCEENEEDPESKIYDAQFKSNEFVIYKNLYKKTQFSPHLHYSLGRYKGLFIDVIVRFGHP